MTERSPSPHGQAAHGENARHRADGERGEQGEHGEHGEHEASAGHPGERAAAPHGPGPHGAAAAQTAAAETAAASWDDFYRSHQRVWSGTPNAALVEEVAALPPGTALDLGSGEGADAVWLARRGWRVTAVDVSRVALDRAAEHAAAAGVGERVDWQCHDLAASFPAGSYDLVSALFLHSFREMPRERVLRAAAAATAPGGLLLIVGHAGPPSWVTDAHAAPEFPTPEEVHAGLDLPAGQWEVLRSAVYERPTTGPDGRPATRPDNTLKLRRLPA